MTSVVVPTSALTPPPLPPLTGKSNALKQYLHDHKEVKWLTLTLAVTTLGLIASLVVTYAYLKPKNKTGSTANGGACAGGKAPVVSSTGKVTNPFTKVVKDAKGVCSCVVDVPALNALCLATRRPDTNDTWDEYDSATQSCVKTKTPRCDQQMCDAEYCTSASVVKMLPPLHKVTLDGKCANPTLLSVQQLCAQLPNTAWKYPDCITIVTQKVINAYDVKGTTTHINGVLSYAYVPAVAGSVLLLRYRVTAGDGKLSDTGNVVLQRESLQCSFPTAGGAREQGCFDFEVYFTRPLEPGAYTLEFTGSGDNINLSSETPTSMTLPLATATVDGGDPALNPVPSAELADNYFSDEAFMNKWIVHLKSLNSTASARYQSDNAFSFLPSPLPRPLPVFVRTVASSKQYGAALAPADLCPLVEHTTLNAQFVVVAWAAPAVAVRYNVTKSVGGVEQVLLSDADGALNSLPAFVDRISVGDVCNYTVCAYRIADGAAGSGDTPGNNNNTYATSNSRSEQVSLCVTGEPFPEEVCAQIACPAEQCALPPVMWSEPTGCVWYPNDQARSDSYCAAQHPAELHLAAPQQNTCMPVGKSYPRVMRLPLPCDEANRVVACPRALPLGTTADTIDNEENFVARVANANLAPSAAYSSYFMCGPLQSPATWGTSTGTCDDDDSACKSFAAAGAAGGSWVAAASSPDGELRFEQKNSCPTFTLLYKKGAKTCERVYDGSGTFPTKDCDCTEDCDSRYVCDPSSANLCGETFPGKGMDIETCTQSWIQDLCRKNNHI